MPDFSTMTDAELGVWVRENARDWYSCLEDARSWMAVDGAPPKEAWDGIREVMSALEDIAMTKDI